MRIGRIRIVLAAASAGAAGFGVVAALPGGAAAHLSGCHSHHTCPSDHHTYVWTDPTTGLGWDCAEPGAPEYDAARDRTTISYGGYTYDCRAAATTATAPATSAAPPRLGRRTKTGACRSRNALPDRDCTPGAVSGATAAEVCTSGYASSVRHVPSSLKRHVYAEYGIQSHARGEYEVDHLVSLELGGSNGIANLWPEPARPAPGFHEKDRLENYLHEEVCRGALSLRRAQREIAHDWRAVYASVPH